MDDHNTSPGSITKSDSFYFMFFLKWLGTAQNISHNAQQQQTLKVKFEIIKGHQVINSIKEPMTFDMRRGWCKGQKVQISFFLKDYSPYRQVQFIAKLSKKTESSEQVLGEIKIKANKYIQAFTNQELNNIQQNAELERYNVGYLIFTQKSRHSLEKIVKMYKSSEQNKDQNILKQIEIMRMRQTSDQACKPEQMSTKLKQNQDYGLQDQKIREEDEKVRVQMKQQPLQLNKEINQQINEQKKQQKLEQDSSKIKNNENNQEEDKLMNQEVVYEVVQEVEQKQQIVYQQKPQQNQHQQEQIKNYMINVKQVQDEQEINVKQVTMQQPMDQISKQNTKQIGQQVEEEIILENNKQKQLQKNEQLRQQKTIQQVKQAVYSTPKKFSNDKNQQKQKSSPKTVQSFKILNEQSKQPKQTKAQHAQKIQHTFQTEVKPTGTNTPLKIIILFLIFGFIGFVGYYLLNMNKLVDETITKQSVNMKKKLPRASNKQPRSTKKATPKGKKKI